MATSSVARIYRRSELESIRPTTDSAGCLYRYRKIWLEQTDDTSDPALIGIAFHSINHTYVLKLREARLGQDFELAQEAFVEGIAAAQTPSRLVPDVHAVWKWHVESFELDLDRFIATEERGASGDVGFTPDLVYAHPESDVLEILDFKSGWQPPIGEPELRGLWQARVYSRYAQDRWPGFSKYAFTLVAVRFRKSVTVSYSHEELDAVELEVRAAIATIQEAERTDVWPATPGPSCRFCGLACPLADDVAVLPKRILPAQVEKLAGWILVAEKQLKAAKKLLKGTVGIVGPTTVNGMTWANRPVESRSYPIMSVVELLHKLGMAGGFDDLTISHSALSRLFKQFPSLADDLAGTVKTKTAYRFGAKSSDPLLEEGEDDE